MRLLALLLALVNAGCGLMIDTAYWLGDGTTSTRVQESRPTGQTVVSTEMDAQTIAEGKLSLTCETRTRNVELQWSVDKTYAYRGGFEPSAYMGGAVLSGMFMAVTAGVLLGLCFDDDYDVSCWHALWASPFALDLGYSLYRMWTTHPPKLIDKRATQSRAAIGRVVSAEKIACPVSQIYVGTTHFPLPDAPRAFVEGTVPVPIDADGTVDPKVQFALLETLATSYAASLWFVDPTEGIMPVGRFDRCQILRANAAHIGSVKPELLNKINTECPLPQPATTTTTK